MNKTIVKGFNILHSKVKHVDIKYTKDRHYFVRFLFRDGSKKGFIRVTLYRCRDILRQLMNTIVDVKKALTDPKEDIFGLYTGALRYLRALYRVEKKIHYKTTIKAKRLYVLSLVWYYGMRCWKSSLSCGPLREKIKTDINAYCTEA